ncbi:MAG: DUF6752 domain-containing protein [Nocardioides sp.]
MDTLKTKARDLRNRTDLWRRLTALEEEVQECRQLNLRLAELCDVMMELLLPAAQRDEAAIAEILERYQSDVSDPASWAPDRPDGASAGE